MEKLGSKGFGAIETVLTVLILGIVGGTGYYVYSQNHSEQKQPVSQQQATPEKEKYSYELPDGWSEIVCDEQNTETNPRHKIASPDSDKAEGCNDRTNVVLIGNLTDANDSAKCLTTSELKKYKESKPVVSYECEEEEINGAQATIKKYDFGEGLNISYEFIGESKPYFTYFNNGNNELPFTKEVNLLVYSAQID